MLEKEALALLRHLVWNMLDDNEPVSALTTAPVDCRTPKPFRLRIAREAFIALTQALGEPNVLKTEGNVEQVIDEIALAFAIAADNARPKNYRRYTPHDFAELLIREFCNGYLQLDKDFPRDGDTVHYKNVHFILPLLPKPIAPFCETLRAMPLQAFGKYTLPK